MFEFPDPEFCVVWECERAYEGFMDTVFVKGIEGYMEDLDEAIQATIDSAA